jgi:transformation/transcription domain-associated protein
LDTHATHSLSISIDVKAQYDLAVHIRDNIEVVHMQEYGNFLNFLFPVFYNHLRTGAPKFNDSTEQKLRNVMLEILNRLPSNDLLKQNDRMRNLMRLAMFLLEVENEENAIICVRIIIELHKNFRPHLDGEVQAFLEIVQKFYSELPKTVKTIFNEAGGAEIQGQASSDPQKPSTSIRSTQSFKVLTECPIIVVLLFQLYPKFLQSNIPKFMPLVIQTLGLQAPKPTRESTLQYRIAFVDFIAAQVKVKHSSFVFFLYHSFLTSFLLNSDSFFSRVSSTRLD